MKKVGIWILAIVILAAVAVGSYFLGYKTAYDRMEDGSARQTILPQTFYGEITEISGDLLSIDGLDVNDINYRDAFTFSVTAETELVWRGTQMQLDEFDVGDTVAVSFAGEVQESYPAHILDVVRLQLLDDEK